MTTIAAGLVLITAGNLNLPEIQRLLKTGLEFSYVENFDSARLYFDSTIALDSLNPAGYFFKAALLQLKMMDECHFDHETEYLELMKKTQRLARNILQEEVNSWAQYYLGSSYAYRAAYEGFKKNYLETFNYGVKGGRMLQDLVRKDSTAYDAYLGCGTFEYFWARAARYLPVLKLAGGNAAEAIRKLEVAASRSLYSGPTAENSLVFIYGEEKKYSRAAELIDQLLARYPRSKTFLWSKADIKYRQRDFTAAAELYTELFDSYNAIEPKNFSNLAQCQLLIGKCYYELQDRDRARAAFREVVTYKDHTGRFPRIRDYCREAYALLGKLL